MSIGPITGNNWPSQINAASSRTSDATESMTGGPLAARSAGNCRVCESRRYVDGSSDPGVSFKSPTRLTPGSAASQVRSHEQEHVSRQAAKARESGGKVVSQTVTVETSLCPGCGRAYVSGGRTRTVMSVPTQASSASSDSTGKGSSHLGSRLDMRL